MARLQQGRNDWYRIENKANSAKIYIYDEIGYWGVTAADFVRDLNALDVKSLEVHLNSPGGEVYDGVAIYNAIKSFDGDVTTIIDGLAASAASFIAQAGKKRLACKNSTMMIHEASGLCIGKASDMRDLADKLDKMTDNIASIYADQAGGSVEFWREAMNAETWYSADEALSAGLVDEIVNMDGEDASNKWDLRVFNFAGRENAPAPQMKEKEPEVDLAASLREALKEVFQ